MSEENPLMIFPPAKFHSRIKTLRVVTGILALSVVITSILGGLPSPQNIRKASAQSISDEILDKVKRARRLFLGKRPCGTLLSTDGKAWRTLSNGLEGRILRVTLRGTETSTLLHVIRADPKAIAVRVMLSKTFGQTSATANEFANRSGALAVMNGGYFGTSFRPLGLLIANKKREKSLVRLRGRRSDALYNGIFFMKNGRPFILRNKDYSLGGEELALQAGPILIANGKGVPTLSGLNDAKRIDGRTIISLDARGRILIWVTSSPLGGMNWCEIRDILIQYSDDGTGVLTSESRVEWGLNLDGGTSAQLHVSGSGELEVKGSPVPVALGFFPKKTSVSE